MAQCESSIPDDHDESTERPHGKNRIRASMACNSCRLRRSRCTVKSDNSECEQCHRSKLPCVFDGNDRRKRRRHRNDVVQLSERLAAVESLLQQSRQADDGGSDPHATVLVDDTSEHDSQWTARHSISGISDQLCTSATTSTDGSIVPCPPVLPQPAHQSKPTLLSQSRIPDDIEQMLFDLFWTKYNPIFQFICQKDFDEARRTKQSNHYSRALHICILAIGLRFTDKQSSGMAFLLGDQRDGPSKLHQRARVCVQEELESSAQLPKAQALLLLGDLECGIGHYSGGRMYSGMACRLAISLTKKLDLTEAASASHFSVIQPLLYACLVFESYWDLILDGSNSVRASDVKMLQFAAKFSIIRVEMDLFVGDKESDISDFLLELAAVSGDTSELAHIRRQSVQKDIFQMIALEHELSSWYNDLPEPVRWNTFNVKFSGSAFFLFHQHYHACVILLHRPFADCRRRSLLDDMMIDERSKKPSASTLSQASRAKCIEHGIHLAKIMIYHHSRFNGRNIAFMAVNHADIAATALLMGLLSTKDKQASVAAASHLKDLLIVTKALAVTYPRALMLSREIKAELESWLQSQASSVDEFMVSGNGGCESNMSSDLFGADSDGMLSVNFDHASKMSDFHFHHSDEGPRSRAPHGIEVASTEGFHEQISSDLQMNSPLDLIPELNLQAGQTSTGTVHSQWDQLSVWDDIFSETLGTINSF